MSTRIRFERIRDADSPPPKYGEWSGVRDWEQVPRMGDYIELEDATGTVRAVLWGDDEQESEDAQGICDVVVRFR